MLTQTSEYALRAMVYLARKGEDKYAGVKEIAKATEVPSNYLAKILQQLAKAGVLESQKGFGGGFRVAGKLNTINLLAVVDPLENISRFKRCVLGQRECNDEVACPLHDAWKRICNEYLGSLERTTLQDVAEFRRKVEVIEGPGATQIPAESPVKLEAQDVPQSTGAVSPQ
jgi:Rrf2 family protein